MNDKYIGLAVTSSAYTHLDPSPAGASDTERGPNSSITPSAHPGATVLRDNLPDVPNEPPLFGDSNHRYGDFTHLPEEVKVALVAYKPYSFSVSRWTEIGDFSKQVVADSNPSSDYEVRERMRITITYLDWVLDVTGSPVSTDLFDGRQIRRYFANFVGGNPSTINRREKRLRAVAAAAIKGNPLTTYSTPQLALAEPYERFEEAQQNSWATSHPQPWRCRDSLVILALGRGGGLEAFEMTALTVDDIIDNNEITTIAVGGVNAREVPIFADQAAALRTVIAAYSIDGHLLSEHSRRQRELMEGFHNRPSIGRPNPRRLRSTWIVRHLNQGSPLPEFLSAAGLTSTSTLNRYMPFVKPTADAARILTGAEVSL